jgi:hypothetical protein
MTRHVSIGGALGAVVVAALLLVDPRTPRDVDWVLLLIGVAPLYLPVAAAALTLGFAKGGVVVSVVLANSLLYAAAGWALWRYRRARLVSSPGARR